MDPSDPPDEDRNFTVPPPPTASQRSATTSGPDEDKKPKSRIPTPKGVDSASTSDGYESSIASSRKIHKLSKKGYQSSTSDISGTSSKTKPIKRKSKRAELESPADKLSANAPPSKKSSLKLVISKKKKDDGISPPYKKYAVTPRAPSTPDVHPKVLREKSPQNKAATAPVVQKTREEKSDVSQKLPLLT